MSAYPVLMHTALHATDCRSLPEFYRQFLGLRYRPGDEIPTDGSDDDSDWLVLLDPTGHRVFAFQQVPALARPTWPTRCTEADASRLPRARHAGTAASTAARRIPRGHSVVRPH
jgi:hypothetical protein